VTCAAATDYIKTTLNGEHRGFELLRPIVETAAQEAMRDRILEAHAEYDELAATA
jgi:hypothetical protein